jgi:hypothetical protein
MNSRSLAVLAALALAPAATFAQEVPASSPAAAPAAAAPAPSRDLASDVDTVGGKVDALAEKLAEIEATVGGLKKLKLSGYVQGRYGHGEKGSYYAIYDKDGYKDLDREGFYVRRGRLKATYDAGDAEAVIQLDATGSGVSLKEAYARLKLPFNLTIDAGQLGIPFGYEVGIVSSANLDVLERSSIVRKLLAGEYDRGVAVGWKYGKLSAKAGLFNGNGVDGWTKDNDALKDVIGRVGYDFGIVNVGLSGWLGKLRVYEYQDLKAGVTSLAPGDYDRNRIGADVQTYLDLLPIGGTSLKAEYLQGETIIDKTDTADALKSLKTGIPQMGWYVSVVQSIGESDAVAVRYDYHDENTDAKDGDANAKATGTVAIAYHHYFGGNFKASALYEIPRQLKGKDGFEDPKDNALTLQLQASF